MTCGFIYKWVDKRNGLMYIGRHEGTTNDGYIGSGVIFRKAYDNRPDDFERCILWESAETTVEEIKEKEEEFLEQIKDNELFGRENTRYYNQVKNSHGFTSTDNPMLNRSIVEKMRETQIRKGLLDPYTNSINKYGKEKLSKILSNNKIGNNYGSGNKNIPKSEKHKLKISRSLLGRKTSSCKLGRKPIILPQELINLIKIYGVKEVAKIYSVSREVIRHRYYRAISKLTGEIK